jgi:selenide, water dikinase
MQDAALPQVTDLVLIGGGHAHALVLRMWAMNPLPGARLTLINPGPVAPYTGMLPGHVAGHYTRSEMMIDLVRLARFAGARLILDHATGIDRARQLIHLAGRPPLAYDLASLDIGITSDLPDLPGFAAHSVSAKPLGPYAARWQAFVASAPARPRLIVVGGGVGGIELAMASAQRLRAAGREPQVTVLEAAPVALPALTPRARDRLMAEAEALGVSLTLNASPVAMTADKVTLASGETLPCDFTLTVTGARPHDWLQATGLELTAGFVRVDACLQTSDPQIFAAGDCADMTGSPRPKAGVFAVRAAPVLFDNLRARLTASALRPFRPQKDYLKLISLGGKSALAEKWGQCLAGPWLWRWKDRIDRKFMAKFAEYPAMARAAPPRPLIPALQEALSEQPLCGGCGAKVGSATLTTALAHLPRPTRADVIAGAGDDAAQLVHGDGVQVITTDHLRAFTHDPRLMARIAAIHALGDIWAMGAAPQVALSQITLPRLSPTLQARTLTEILDAAAEVFAAAGADVVGGHTTVGAELTVGFTVTGLARHPITKSGAQPGDALILTKALGSGTVMAAEMAMVRLPGLMLGDCVAAALGAMAQGQDDAATHLAPHAHAMTDVTGFGLAGHLIEMLEASGCAATLLQSQIPCLPGAVELAAAGHASSIAPANRAALIGRVTGQSGPATPLLYDPQTGGGLLAAVPSDQVPGLLAALRACDPQAALIGHITAGDPHITLLP